MTDTNSWRRSTGRSERRMAGCLPFPLSWPRASLAKHLKCTEQASPWLESQATPALICPTRGPDDP